MKTLSEIIDFAQDGNMPTHEECYWAMLALNGLHYLNFKRLMDLASAVKEQKPSVKMRAEMVQKSAFESNKTAMSVTPKHWLGPSHDPSTNECQAFRKMAKGILNHVMSQPENPS